MTEDLGIQLSQDTTILDAITRNGNQSTILVLGEMFTGKSLSIKRVLRKINSNKYKFQEINYENMSNPKNKDMIGTIGKQPGTILEAHKYAIEYLLNDGPAITHLNSESEIKKFSSWIKLCFKSRLGDVIPSGVYPVEFKLSRIDIESIFDYSISDIKEDRKREFQELKSTLIEFSSIKGNNDEVIFIPKLLVRILKDDGSFNINYIKARSENYRNSDRFLMECFGLSLLSTSVFRSYGSEIISGIGAAMNSLSVVPFFAPVGAVIFGVSTLFGLFTVSKDEKYGRFIKLYQSWNETPEEKQKIIGSKLDEKYKLPPNSSYTFLSQWLEKKKEDKFIDNLKSILTESFFNKINQVSSEIVGLKEAIIQHAVELDDLRRNIDNLSHRVHNLELRTSILEQKISNFNDLRTNEEIRFFSPNEEEKVSINNNFIFPNGYNEMLSHAVTRPLIINGLLHAGKDYVAQKISLDISARTSINNVYWVDLSNVDLRELARVMKSKFVIVLKNAFGTLSPSVYDEKIFIELFHNSEVTEGKYLILTTRESIWNRLEYQQSSIYKILRDNCYVYKIDEKSYREDELNKLYLRLLDRYSAKISPVNYNLLKKEITSIVSELNLPGLLKIFMDEKMHAYGQTTIDLQDLLEQTKDLESASGDWFIRLVREDNRSFLAALFIALFPGLTPQMFIKVFNSVNKKHDVQLSGFLLESILEENSQFISNTDMRGVNYTHTVYLSGVWKKIEQFGSDYIEDIIDDIYSAMDLPSYTLQAGMTLSKLSTVFPNLILKYSVNIFRTTKNQYKSHMAAITIGTVYRLNKTEIIRKNVKSFISSLLSDSRKRRIDTGIFILMLITRDSVIDSTDIFEHLLGCYDAQIPYILEKITPGLGNNAQKLEIMNLLDSMLDNNIPNFIEIKQVLKTNLDELNRESKTHMVLMEEELIRNNDFTSGLHSWLFTDNETIKYEIIEEGNAKVCRIVEQDVSNLGRLYQKITGYLNERLITPGSTLLLEAEIKTEGVTTVNQNNGRGGFCVGVAYVDEGGWTPELDSYQFEVGHLTGDTNWPGNYSGKFVLGYKPRSSSDLIVYIDFNNSKGIGYVKKVSLKIINE